MKNTPTNIKLHSKSKLLEISYKNEIFILPCEYLRVYSPSAEVKGHGPGQEVLQTGKENITVVAIEPVGHYAVRLIFSDSHNSGLFSWDYLYELGKNRQKKWQNYLVRLDEANVTREPQTSIYINRKKQSTKLHNSQTTITGKTTITKRLCRHD